MDCCAWSRCEGQGQVITSHIGNPDSYVGWANVDTGVPMLAQPTLLSEEEMKCEILILKTQNIFFYVM